MADGRKNFAKPAVRIALFLLWATATLAISWALFDGRSGATDGDKLVATLTSSKGQVRVMPTGSILWNDAIQDQGLAYGDTLATGPNSRATIKMSRGRILTLGPNSMVSIEEEGQGADGRGPAVALSLLRGEIVASVTKDVKDGSERRSLDDLFSVLGGSDSKEAGPAALTIATPTKSFVVSESGASLSLFKGEDDLEPIVTNIKGDVRALAAGEDDTALSPAVLQRATRVTEAEVASAPAPEAKVEAPTANLALLSVEPLATKPAVAPPSTTVATPRPKKKPKPATPEIKAPAPKLAVQKIAPVTLPSSPEPAPEPVEVIATPQLAPRIAQSVPRSLATPLTLAEACRGDLNVAVEPPPGSGEKLKGWTPILEAQLAGQAGPVIRVEGKPVYAVQNLKLPIAQLCVLGGKMAREMISLVLRTGVRLKDDGPEAFSTAQRPLILMSLAELPDRPVTVHLSRVIAVEGETKGWLPMKSGNDLPTEAPFALSLVSTKLLPKIFPLLRGNRTIVISRKQPQGYAQRVQLATGSGQLLGSLASATRKEGALRRVSSVLGAEIAFVGRPEALVALPITRLNRLNLLEAMVNNEGGVTLISRQRAVLLRREDVESNPASVRALGIGATVAFKGNVEIVLPK